MVELHFTPGPPALWMDDTFIAYEIRQIFLICSQQFTEDALVGPQGTLTPTQLQANYYY